MVTRADHERGSTRPLERSRAHAATRHVRRLLRRPPLAQDSDMIIICDNTMVINYEQVSCSLPNHARWTLIGSKSAISPHETCETTTHARSTLPRRVNHQEQDAASYIMFMQRGDRVSSNPGNNTPTFWAVWNVDILSSPLHINMYVCGS